jgi:2-dehydro-3-deoxygalactonokinase
MPGTHTKWVALKDGVIEHFLTAVSGELYDVVHRHSVLTGGAAGDFSPAAFEAALDQTKAGTKGDLIHLLFQVRSRRLSGEMTPPDAAAFLSGLIIGQDVAGAACLLHAEMTDAGPITVIGAPRLAGLYGAALKAQGHAAQTIDGDAAAQAGLFALYQTMEHAGHGG